VTVDETIQLYINPGAVLVPRRTLAKGTIPTHEDQNYTVVRLKIPKIAVSNEEWKSRATVNVDIWQDVKDFEDALWRCTVFLQKKMNVELHINKTKHLDGSDETKFMDALKQSPHLWPEVIRKGMPLDTRFLKNPQMGADSFYWIMTPLDQSGWSRQRKSAVEDKLREMKQQGLIQDPNEEKLHDHWDEQEGCAETTLSEHDSNQLLMHRDLERYITYMTEKSKAKKEKLPKDVAGWYQSWRKKTMARASTKSSRKVARRLAVEKLDAPSTEAGLTYPKTTGSFKGWQDFYHKVGEKRLRDRLEEQTSKLQEANGNKDGIEPLHTIPSTSDYYPRTNRDGREHMVHERTGSALRSGREHERRSNRATEMERETNRRESLAQQPSQTKLQQEQAEHDRLRLELMLFKPPNVDEVADDLVRRKLRRLVDTRPELLPPQENEVDEIRPNPQPPVSERTKRCVRGIQMGGMTFLNKPGSTLRLRIPRRDESPEFQRGSYMEHTEPAIGARVRNEAKIYGHLQRPTSRSHPPLKLEQPKERNELGKVNFVNPQEPGASRLSLPTDSQTEEKKIVEQIPFHNRALTVDAPQWSRAQHTLTRKIHEDSAGPRNPPVRIVGSSGAGLALELPIDELQLSADPLCTPHLGRRAVCTGERLEHPLCSGEIAYQARMARREKAFEIRDAIRHQKKP